MDRFEFRGRTPDGDWRYGSLLVIDGHPHIIEDSDMTEDGHHVRQESDRPTWVDEETVGPFSGRLDNNGRKIFAGDVITYFSVEQTCINSDCEPFNHIYENFIEKKTAEVKFSGGMFTVGDDDMPLLYAGILDVDEIREWLNLSEEDGWSDCNGTVVDDSVTGVEVVGNIFDDSEI